MSCATPPYAKASGTTTAVKVAASPVSRPALMQLRTTVVSPKPAKPRGAGFAGRKSSFDIECLLSRVWIEGSMNPRGQAALKSIPSAAGGLYCFLREVVKVFLRGVFRGKSRYRIAALAI